MLDELMEKIGDAEHAYVNNQSINEKHETSFGPLKKPNRIHSRDSGLSMGAYNYEYLPCHYFGMSHLFLECYLFDNAELTFQITLQGPALVGALSA